MTEFTDEQMSKAIFANEPVKESFFRIIEACQLLKKKTSCPDEDIDRLLKYSVGKWKL